MAKRIVSPVRSFVPIGKPPRDKGMREKKKYDGTEYESMKAWKHENFRDCQENEEIINVLVRNGRGAGTGGAFECKQPVGSGANRLL